MNKLKVVSWNIAGGYPIASLESFDYAEENISYFVNQIKLINPDIICLQESHTSHDASRIIAQEIAENLGMKYILNSPASPSHVNEKYQLGTAILSRIEFTDSQVFWYPDPSMELFFKDGRKAITHKKNLQLVKIEDFFIANTQMLPLTIFGYSYDDNKEGSQLAAQINEVLRNVSNPVIWCGDFNFNNPRLIYSRIEELNLAEALPDKITRPTKDGSKKTPDHIYYSPEFKLIESDVITTNSDHYLCFAEFEI